MQAAQSRVSWLSGWKESVPCETAISVGHKWSNKMTIPFGPTQHIRIRLVSSQGGWSGQVPLERRAPMCPGSASGSFPGGFWGTGLDVRKSGLNNQRLFCPQSTSDECNRLEDRPRMPCHTSNRRQLHNREFSSPAGT